VANNEIDATKNAGKSTTILMIKWIGAVLIKKMKKSQKKFEVMI